jgi:hypothetical protein
MFYQVTLGRDGSLTLLIRPVRLKKSVYFRVPSDIVDLIGLQDNSQVALTLEEKDDRHLLVYSVIKTKPLGMGAEPESYPLAQATVPGLGGRNQLTERPH